MQIFFCESCSYFLRNTNVHIMYYDVVRETVDHETMGTLALASCAFTAGDFVVL